MSAGPQTFILMGRSGSGKGTQAKLLLEYLKTREPRRRALYLETGARFRALAAKSSFTARRVRESLAEGNLLPEFLAVWNWSEFFLKKLTGREHLVIDGAPRAKREAQALDSAFAFYDRRPVTVFLVEVSAAWARTRLRERGREDDRREADITARLRWFEREVVPAINFFKGEARYRVVSINGEQTIEAVQEEIIANL